MKIVVIPESERQVRDAQNLARVLQLAAPWLVDARVVGNSLEMRQGYRAVPPITVELAGVAPPPLAAPKPAAAGAPRELIFDHDEQEKP